jgi:hypothetical protein
MELNLFGKIGIELARSDEIPQAANDLRHPGTAVRRVQHFVNGENESVEFGAFNRELLAASRRERVVPGRATGRLMLTCYLRRFIVR